jgi:hypothetical protein
MAPKRFEYAQAEEIRNAFDHHGVRYLRRVEVEGFPVCHPDDIIRSKVTANRVKDRESLPRLIAFRDYWKRQRP